MVSRLPSLPHHLLCTMYQTRRETLCPMCSILCLRGGGFNMWCRLGLLAQYGTCCSGYEQSCFYAQMILQGFQRGIQNIPYDRLKDARALCCSKPTLRLRPKNCTTYHSKKRPFPEEEEPHGPRYADGAVYPHPSFAQLRSERREARPGLPSEIRGLAAF